MGVCMLDSRKLFFSQQLDFNNRIEQERQVVNFKKIATSALSRLSMLFFLGLPAQVLFAEGVIDQTANQVTDDINGQKAAVASPATSASY